MDILYWTNLNQKIKLEETSAFKYKKYLALAKYRTEGCSFLRPYSTRWKTASDYIQWRQGNLKNYNMMGSWRMNTLGNADVAQLDHFKSVLSNPAYEIKHRIEEPYLTVYAIDEEHLKSIVTILGFQQHLKTVIVPKYTTDIELLKSGVLFRKNDNGYKYKVIMRDHWKLDDTVVTSIADYLVAQGSNVLLSQNVLNRLGVGTKKRGIFYNVWFYANDLSFLTFLELMAPKGVSKIQEVVVR